VPARQQIAKEKSPAVGVLLAIFPGALVHGLGNYYAGKTDRGNELFKEQGYGMLFMGIGTGLLFLGFKSQDDADDSDDAEKRFHQASGLLSFVGSGVTGLIGIVMFFDSWFRDIYETPAACRDSGVDWKEGDWDDPLDEDFGDERKR
jgi:hypothetical protein